MSAAVAEAEKEVCREGGSTGALSAVGADPGTGTDGGLAPCCSEAVGGSDRATKDTCLPAGACCTSVEATTACSACSRPSVLDIVRGSLVMACQMPWVW
eukprot:CAMPEP_0169193464 /NCGR_PEP_ID=MMETSP1016-20121227/6184_1 /TAXON_ID=342587 /ORGANISM="Karlodinium micrum, Strain CCMP2283" /LENGTH=98 /DNA_ID=CAMNT_0009269917 /DNA_START=504 /DNA_END=797 /DNA_ORIENTATION=-